MAADNLPANGGFEQAKSASDDGVGAPPVAWSP